MGFFERWRSLSRKKTSEELDAHYQKMDELELEKGDILAMVLAGFLVLLPLLLVIGISLLLVLLLFRAI